MLERKIEDIRRKIVPSISWIAPLPITNIARPMKRESMHSMKRKIRILIPL